MSIEAEQLEKFIDSIKSTLPICKVTYDKLYQIFLFEAEEPTIDITKSKQILANFFFRRDSNLNFIWEVSYDNYREEANKLLFKLSNDILKFSKNYLEEQIHWNYSLNDLQMSEINNNILSFSQEVAKEILNRKGLGGKVELISIISLHITLLILSLLAIKDSIVLVNESSIFSNYKIWHMLYKLDKNSLILLGSIDLSPVILNLSAENLMRKASTYL